MIAFVLWTSLAIWLFGFIVLMLLYLLIDEDKMSFAKAMANLLSIIFWPFVLVYFMITSKRAVS